MDPKQRQFSIVYVWIALSAMLLIQIVMARYFRPTTIPYSEFKAAVAAGKVEEVSISSTVIHGRMKPEAPPTEGSPAEATVGARSIRSALKIRT